MPSPAIENTLAAQDKTLSALRESQAAVVDVVETWAKAVENSVPDLPAIPVASSLPTPEEIIKTSYDFAGKVLAGAARVRREAREGRRPGRQDHQGRRRRA